MLKFYDIDEKYIQFLKTIDSQVPDVKYESNNKFVCGVMLIFLLIIPSPIDFYDFPLYLRMILLNITSGKQSF